VTIPHKIDAMHAVDEVDPTARDIGCINTVVNDGGRLFGYNSDGLGALGALREAGADPRGGNVLVLGSGGAARAVAVTIAREAPPAQMTILGVEMDQLAQLTEDVRRRSTGLVEGGELTLDSLRAALARSEIVLHCSPVGMHPKTDESLVRADDLRAGTVVFDAVYNPRRTKLLRAAAAAGCRTVEGVEMFLGQACVQFELWTGKPAPREVMRRVLEEKL
jgi:shikimate dehydrogenase